MCIRDRPYITVGREFEIQALLTDLSLISDGGASFRFLVGRYGAGKSFLLQTIRTHAMGAVSYTHLDVYKRQPPTCSALTSTSRRISGRLALSSSMVKAFEGWNGSAIMGRTAERSTSTQPS